MSVQTYDAKKVSVIVGGAAITGYAKGTFIKVSREEDAFTKYVGADGTVTRGKTNNNSGMVEITLAKSSPSNDMLSALFITDQLNGTGVVPVIIKDNSGTTLHTSSAAWIKKPADWEGAKEVTENNWGLDCADLSMFLGGNTVTGTLPPIGV